MGKWHPGVVILEKEGSLYMTGTIRIESDNSHTPPLLFHIYKELDNDFCKELAYDTVSGIILMNGEEAVSGTMDPEYYISKIQEMMKEPPQQSGERFRFDQIFL